MDKEQFKYVLDEEVLPLFIGAKIVGEEESYDRELEVAQGPSGSMLVKPHKTDNYRYIVKRSQPFKNKDIALVKIILSEITKIYELNVDEPQYIKKLTSLAIEKAISFYLSETCYNTILGIISEFSEMSQTTYEGNHISFGFVINDGYVYSHNYEMNYKALLSHDFSYLLTDGKKSVIELDQNGYLLNHTIFQRQRQIMTYCPQEYIPLSIYCSDKRIGIVLQENGDMLIFKNHALLFAKRRGVWNVFDHENMINMFSGNATHTAKDIRKALYMTCMDVSFSGKGGCIAYLDKDYALGILDHIDIKDIITEKHFELKKQKMNQEKEMLYNIFNDPETATDELTDNFESFTHKNKCEKSIALNHIIGTKKFNELHRKLREELVAIDGATIIDSDGTIIAVGAIIKIEAGSTGGGRLAASKTLSKYGVSVKISTDGIIQGFSLDKKKNQVKQIFSIG